MNDKTVTRTARKAAEELARDLVLNDQEAAIEVLALRIHDAMYLSMKEEWDLEDNCMVTEGVAMGTPLPDLTDDEVVDAMDDFGLEADDLDTPWREAHDRAMERAEGE